MSLFIARSCLQLVNAVQGTAAAVDVYCARNSGRTTVATHGIYTTKFKAATASNPKDIKINQWDMAVLCTADTLPGNTLTLGQVCKGIVMYTRCTLCS